MKARSKDVPMLKIIQSGAHAELKKFFSDATDKKILNGLQKVLLMGIVRFRVFLIEFDVTTPLSMLQNETASSFFRAGMMRRTPAMSQVAARYPTARRRSMTDAAAAALKGERAIAAALGMHHGSQDKCGVHRTSNMQQKTNLLFQGLISMLIAMALTLGEGSTMGLFREDALFVFRRDFRFRRGHVS